MPIKAWNKGAGADEKICVLRHVIRRRRRELVTELNSANRKYLVFDGEKKPGDGAASKAFFYSL